MSRTLLPLSFVFLLPSLVVSIALIFGLDVRGQQIFLFFLLLFLLYVARQLLQKKVRLFHLQTQTVLLFLLTLLIQLLLTSSGGFYSPFLVGVHLVTLGVGFFLSMSAGMVFLSGVLITLFAHLRFDPTIVYIFQEDPWTIILYILSFVALVPITHQLVEQYQLKESVARFLNRQLQVNVARESLILGGLREMVIVLNPRLEILSVNQAVRITLSGTNHDFLFKSVFEKIPLKHTANGTFTPEGVGFDRVLRDKAARTINGYTFVMPGGQEIPVEVQIRPVVNPTGMIEQVVLVIHPERNSDKDEGTAHQATYPVYAEAIDGGLALLQETLQSSTPAHAQAEARILYSLIDANASFELEDHLITERKKLEDIEELLGQSISKLEAFARSYGSKITLEAKEDLPVAQPLVPKGVVVLTEVIRTGTTAEVDRYWLETLLQRILRLSILLSTTQQGSRINASLKSDNSIVVITVNTNYEGMLSEDDILAIGVDAKSGTPLAQSSGFEGFIITKICSQTNLHFEVQRTEKGELVFELSIPRGPQG